MEDWSGAREMEEGKLRRVHISFLFASDLPFSQGRPLPSPRPLLSTHELARGGPLPVRFRCLDLPARAASLVRSLALESLEIEIRFSRQYFAGRTDRPTATEGWPPAAPQRHAAISLSLSLSRLLY